MHNFDLLNLTEFLLKNEKQDLAERIVDSFFENSFDYFQFLEISKCYAVLKKFDKRVLVFRNMLKTAPNVQSFNETKFNFVTALRQISSHEEALFHLDYFFYFLNSPEIWITKAEIFWDLNKKNKCYEILNSIPNEVLDETQKGRLQYNLGYCLLDRGNFEEGLEKVIKNVRYKKGYDLNNFDIYHTKKELNLPFWDGTQDVKKLIVFSEAGIGDEIINSRFMKILEEKNIQAFWFSFWHQDAASNGRKGVFEVLEKNNIPVIADLNHLNDIREYHWTYSQYLPINLKIKEGELWKGPYLKAEKIKLSEKMNIGIRWGGALIPSNRNYPLKDLYSVFQELNLDANFYSLQKDNFLNEIFDFEGIIDLKENLDNFENLMNYLNSMDLIVTSDTSIAHAAAALGKEVAVFVPISSYYVWTHLTEKSPWYGDNVTIFRQEALRDWSGPMQKFKDYLKVKYALRVN